MGVHWKDWCWSWNSNTLATSCEELTHLKRPWWWERLGAGGKGDDRGWDGCMASPTQWTWVWVNSGSWTGSWWTGRPGVLQFMGLQRVRPDWATKLNWTDGCESWTIKKAECWRIRLNWTEGHTCAPGIGNQVIHKCEIILYVIHYMLFNPSPGQYDCLR